MDKLSDFELNKAIAEAKWGKWEVRSTNRLYVEGYGYFDFRNWNDLMPFKSTTRETE